MSRTIQAFIFDLDGVIVDTARYHFESWKQLAHELGFEIPDSLNEELKGLGRMESLDKVLAYGNGQVSDDKKEEYAARKNNIYLDNISHIAPGDTLPGVLEFLADTRRHGIRIALGSGSKNAGSIIERLQLTDTFDAVCDGNDISRSKPDPEIFQCACRALNVSPEHAIVFEDAAAGIEAAKHCGTVTVGIGDPENLENADHVIPGFTGISVRDILASIS